jgi:predicted RNA-binding protein YlxR (DUF448 family)/ribosomal protein L7Ae-like RNA K-turn-binding protein
MADVFRQCIACRKRSLKRDLIRVVRTPSGNVEFDPQQLKPGRGAYLCAGPECITESRDKKLITAHLQRPVPAALYLELAGQLKRSRSVSVESLLGFAKKAGQCALGMTAVQQMLKRGRIRLLIVSQSAGESTRAKLDGLSRHYRVPIVLYGGERSLEDAVGKVNCRTVGILDSRFAAKIGAACRRPGD